MSNILKEDLEIISNIDFSKFKSKTFFITGVTGLVGVAIVRALFAINDKQHLGIKVIGLARNVRKANQLLQEYIDREEFTLYLGDIVEGFDIREDVDFIIHCASVTTSKTMIEKPVETIVTSIEGTKNILDLAYNKKSESVVYISSMEMYGDCSEIKHDITENDLGYINPLKIRSNYPESKRMCENMCIAYWSEYNIPVKIARLAQTFGAGILPGENRVFAQFARSVIERKNIVLHTEGKSEGNYIYTRDMLIGIFMILLDGANGEAYNVSNPSSHVTIADMANIVANEVANGEIKVEFDIPATNTYGYASDTKMKLNSDKLQKMGWEPKVGLIEAYNRMIAEMREVCFCGNDNAI